MIILDKPNAEEFRRIREAALDDYTREGKTGTWPSAEIARQEFDRWLPDGLDTKNQHLLVIRTPDGIQVGTLFLAVIERPTGKEAFILSLEIVARSRRRGYAEEALRQLEKYVAGLGLDTVSLSVFEHNKAATSLYQKVGYSPIFTRMTKKLQKT